jgi:3-hydroxybutyryl-CoA dehydrogenase
MTEAPPRRVAVIGAGTMGSGIALSFALAGSDVVLISRSPRTLAAARARMEHSLELLVECGAASVGAVDRALELLEVTTDLDHAPAGAELVLESVIEEPAVKQEVLARAERAAPAAVLATDTSSLSIDALAAALRRPEAFAGFHWFNPPELVPLVEVIAGAATAPDTVERLLAWARAAGKRPVHVRCDLEGFVANRLQYALLREAFSLVERGICGYVDVDEAVRFGLGARWAAIGPFESLDLAGLDVHLAVARRLYPSLSRGTEPAESVSRLVAEGALGCKTGRGLYGEYDDEAVTSLARRRARVLLALARLEGDAGAPVA